MAQHKCYKHAHGSIICTINSHSYIYANIAIYTCICGQACMIVHSHAHFLFIYAYLNSYSLSAAIVNANILYIINIYEM